MTSNFFQIINLIRTEFPSANIYNFWQIASEVDYNQVSEPKISEIIKKLQKEQPIFQCTKNNELYQQIQFSTFFSLQKRILKLLDDGFVIVCDDTNTWEKLLKLTIPKEIHRLLDWIYITYKYTRQQTQSNFVEIIRHPFLQQNKNLKNIGVEWEYSLRKGYNQFNQKKPLPHPLDSFCRKLSSEKNFYTLFLETLKNLPDDIRKQIIPFSEHLKILDDGPFCVEWFKKSSYLKEGSPQIRLGLHEALKFKPEHIIFCLKHNQIKPILGQSLLKKSSLDTLSKQLFEWAEKNILNVLCYSTEPTFFHPLIQENHLQKHLEPKIRLEAEKPIANPPITSRPTTISASGFSLLMQDPYGFYARYILKLNALERITSQHFSKEFGLATHKAIEIYFKEGIENAIQYTNILKLSKPEILWKNKLLRILNWIENQIHDLNPSNIQSEHDAQTTIHTITLKARIDALLNVDANNLVINFKTGTPPPKADVMKGYSPQLAIEMFLIQKLYNTDSVQAEFWQLKSTQPSGAISSSIALPMNALQKELEKIICHYFMTNSPFLTCPWTSKTSKYNEYKNLERSN